MFFKKLSLAAVALSFTLTQCAFAQGVSPTPSDPNSTANGESCNLLGAPVTLPRVPLIGTAPSAPALGQPTGELPPPIGAGPTPVPVTPGMGGPPTNLPWVPAVPFNTIGSQNTGLALPVSPAIETPPGVLGQILTPVIPPPPSTPGADPGNLTAPTGSFNPAADVFISPTGGIPGNGGYCTTIPTVRRGGQESHQWELRGRNSSLAGLGGDGTQDEITRLGPNAGWGMPFGVPTGDGLRNSSVDLGGGMRMRVGGSTVSTGSSVQDYGLSDTRGNPHPSLASQQSTEFGQGWRRIPIYTSNTTDYGFPYRQFSPANISPQKTGQRLLPRAVITNF